jgi:hypothetical protein
VPDQEDCLYAGPLPKYPITLTPEQEARLQSLSTCYTVPYAEVQRARLLLLAHHHPTWCNAAIARQVGPGVAKAEILAK